MDEGAGTNSGLKARWTAMPRSAKWGLYAVAAIVAYFFAIEPALTKMGAWNARAGTKEVALNQYDKDRRARADLDKAATDAVKNYGEVLTPADSAARSQELNKQVQAALDANGVKRPTMTAREVLVPANSALSRQFGTDHRVERLVSEIVFDAEPEQVAKVVADLEQVPEIARVSRLVLRQKSGENEGGRQVSATIWVEAWQLKQKVGRPK